MKFNVIHVVTEFNVPEKAKVVVSNVTKKEAIEATADYFQKEWNRYYDTKGHDAIVDYLKGVMSMPYTIWKHEAVIDTHNDDNRSHYIFFQVVRETKSRVRKYGNKKDVRNGRSRRSKKTG